MARVKQNSIQRSFQQMELREDFLESDDLEVRSQSLRSALNMKCLATRIVEARPGTFFVADFDQAEDVVSLRPETGVEFGLKLEDNAFQIVDRNGAEVFTQNIVPWDDARRLWVNPMRDEVMIGDPITGLYLLKYNRETKAWAFSNFEFAPAPGGELAQPYWVHQKNATIQPSATTGSITITASTPIWSEGYVGLRIRYGGREILITERVSATVLKGDVINSLPPSYNVTVQDSREYRVGEAVVGADTNFQGIIVGISGTVLSVATQAFFEGPSVGEELSGPAGSSSITAKSEVSPVASPVWDEPLMSKLRGFPRSSANISGRIVLLDFESVSDLIVLSSSRGTDDFSVGANDDDAIVRQVGESGQRWMHAVNMGDLVLFSDNGVHIVQSRQNGAITPSNFETEIVDETSSSTVRPVRVDDGVVFVEASGEAVSAVFLDGNVYLKWSVRRLSTFHSHLIKSPKRLCGPSLGSTSAEKYMFVVNGDGTIAAVSWQQNMRDETIGFAPWVTSGSFVNVVPIFGGYYAIVEREIAGKIKRFWERFSDDAVLDCAITTETLSQVGLWTADGQQMTVNGNPLVLVKPLASHLAGATVSYFLNGWDSGDFQIGSIGEIIDEPMDSGNRQIGFNFMAEIAVWPVEKIDSGRIGSFKARVFEATISVQNTLSYDAIMNGHRQTVSAYKAGDDLSEPPSLVTEVRRFSIYGNRDHPDIKFQKTRPGQFRVLAVGQGVQG
jgi:hypothetical protein